MRIAILITGHVRNSLEYNDLTNVINKIQKLGECDIYSITSNKKDHSTKTWYHIDESLQNQNIDYYRLLKTINFKKIQIYEEKQYPQLIKDKLWGRSPLSYVGVESIYKNIKNCLNLLETEYDYIFRLRYDYYKFDNGKYTEKIIHFIQNFDFKYNNVTSLKVGNYRGEDSFFVSDSKNFIKIIDFIVNNFAILEEYARKAEYYFMPEDLIKYSCNKQNISYTVI